MNLPVLVLVVSQALFTTSDLMARNFMAAQGFNLSTFTNLWFAGYIAIRVMATTSQLYVFTAIKLGETMGMFGAVSIIFANALGYLVLGEVLAPQDYIGISLAVIAFILLAFW